MGYTSDVALALSRQGFALLMDKLTDTRLPNGMRLAARKLLYEADTHGVDSCAHAHLWQWENIKWRRANDGVCFLERLMSQLADKDYRFVRLGGDDDDTEIRGSLYEPYAIHVHRHIAVYQIPITREENSLWQRLKTCFVKRH